MLKKSLSGALFNNGFAMEQNTTTSSEGPPPVTKQGRQNEDQNNPHRTTSGCSDDDLTLVVRLRRNLNLIDSKPLAGAADNSHNSIAPLQPVVRPSDPDPQLNGSRFRDETDDSAALESMVESENDGEAIKVTCAPGELSALIDAALMDVDFKELDDEEVKGSRPHADGLQAPR